MIHIDTKLVEVSRTDLDELGLDWNTLLLDDRNSNRNRGFTNEFGAVVAEPDMDQLMELINRPVKIPSSPTGWNQAVGETKQVQAQLDGLLTNLRQLQDTGIVVETRFITLKDNFFERIGVDFDFETEDPDPPILSDDRITDTDSPGLDLNFTTISSDDDKITLRVDGGNFYLPDEKTVDFFGGGARGTMGNSQSFTQMRTIREQDGVEPFFDGKRFIDIPVFRDRTVTTRETFSDGSFADEADIFGMSCACYYGLHFGIGATVQYLDGDIRGAWTGELNAIGRFPIETPNLGISPYVIGGVGGFFGVENLPTVSLGGGVEFRTTSRFGLYTEAKYTWTDDSDMNYSSVVGGIRFVTDGIGRPRFNKTVSVNNGGTVILGGLLDPIKVDEKPKLPLLGNIPFVGRLFQSRPSEELDRGLMMMIKPRIISLEEAED